MIDPDEERTQRQVDFFERCLEQMAADGRIVKTNRIRRGRDGRMHSVYVHRDYADTPDEGER